MTFTHWEILSDSFSKAFKPDRWSGKCWLPKGRKNCGYPEEFLRTTKPSARTIALILLCRFTFLSSFNCWSIGKSIPAFSTAFSPASKHEPFTLERTEIASGLISLFANKQAVSVPGRCMLRRTIRLTLRQ